MLITLNSFTIPAQNLPDGDLEVRLWYNQGFIDSEGQAVQSGTATTGTQIRASATVSSGVITVENIPIYTTLDAQVPFPQSINLTAQFFNGNTPLPIYPFQMNGTGTSWLIYNPSPATEWDFDSLAFLNQASQVAYPPQTYPTTAEMVAYVNSIASVPDASTTVKGKTKLSVAPVSATNPIAVGDNDPRLVVPDASTSVKGISRLSAAPVSPTDPVAVGDNDTRMTNARTPTGPAGGALTGTYPNPTLAIPVIGGSTGSVDNRILRADGTGGSTLQNSPISITDASRITWEVAGETEMAIAHTRSAGSTNVASVTSSTPLGGSTTEEARAFLTSTNSDGASAELATRAAGSTAGGGNASSGWFTMSVQDLTFKGLNLGNNTVPSAALDIWGRGASSNGITDIIIARNNRSGTPASGFGAGMNFKLETTLEDDIGVDAGRVSAIWTVATHASRTSAVTVDTVSNAGALTETIRFAPSGIFTPQTFTVAPAGNYQTYAQYSGSNESGPGLFVHRTVGSEASDNEHGVVDATQFGRANRAYASFDSQPVFTGTNNYDHISNFQARAVMSSSGTLSNYYGFFNFPTTTAGTVTNMYGFYASVGSAVPLSITNRYAFVSEVNAGFWGVGTITPNHPLTVGTPETPINTNALVGVYSTANAYGLYRDTTNNIEVAIGTDSGTGGFLGTFTNHAFLINTNAVTRLTLSNAGLLRLHAYGAGTLQTDASGNVTAVSDERLKDVTGGFKRGLREVRNLNPILYKWLPGSGMDVNGEYAGITAQNVQQSIPEAVSAGPDGYLALQDRPLIMTLINAVKELDAELQSLRKGAEHAYQG